MCTSAALPQVWALLSECAQASAWDRVVLLSAFLCCIVSLLLEGLIAATSLFCVQFIMKHQLIYFF